MNPESATGFSEGTMLRSSRCSQSTAAENKPMRAHSCEHGVRKQRLSAPRSPHSQQGPPSAACHSRAEGGEKGWLCHEGYRGEGKESSGQNSLFLARNSLSVSLPAALWGAQKLRGGHKQAWRGPSASRNTMRREWCASSLCGMPGVAKEKLFQVQLSYNLFFLTDHYCCRLYK